MLLSPEMRFPSALMYMSAVQLPVTTAVTLYESAKHYLSKITFINLEKP